MTALRNGTRVLIRYFAAAGAAAGVEQEVLVVGAPATVSGVIRAAGLLHGPELVTVFTRCSYLLDEIAVHEFDTPMHEGQALDVLPPFAGG